MINTWCTDSVVAAVWRALLVACVMALLPSCVMRCVHCTPHVTFRFSGSDFAVSLVYSLSARVDSWLTSALMWCKFIPKRCVFPSSGHVRFAMVKQKKIKKQQTTAKLINSHPRLFTLIVSRGRFFLKPRCSGQTAFVLDCGFHKNNFSFKKKVQFYVVLCGQSCEKKTQSSLRTIKMF